MDSGLKLRSDINTKNKYDKYERRKLSGVTVKVASIEVVRFPRSRITKFNILFSKAEISIDQSPDSLIDIAIAIDFLNVPLHSILTVVI